MCRMWFRRRVGLSRPCEDGGWEGGRSGEGRWRGRGKAKIGNEADHGLLSTPHGERVCQLSEGRTPRADTSPHPRRVRETVDGAEEAQLAKEGERGPSSSFWYFS